MLNILKVLHSDISNRNQDLPNATGKKQSASDMIKQLFALSVARFSEEKKNILGLNNIWCLSHDIDTQQWLLHISDCSFYWLLVPGLYPVQALKMKLKWTTYSPFVPISKVMAEIISS